MRAFKVPTGNEPIKVTDLDTNGYAFFDMDEKLLAYQFAAWIVNQGHNYRIEFREVQP